MQKHVQCGDIYNQAGHYYPCTAIGLWEVCDIASALSPTWRSSKVWSVHREMSTLNSCIFLVWTQFVHLCIQTIWCLVHKYATFASLFKISMLTLPLLRCLMRSALSPDKVVFAAFGSYSLVRNNFVQVCFTLKKDCWREAKGAVRPHVMLWSDM